MRTKQNESNKSNERIIYAKRLPIEDDRIRCSTSLFDIVKLHPKKIRVHDRAHRIFMLYQIQMTKVHIQKSHRTETNDPGTRSFESIYFISIALYEHCCHDK